MEDGADELLIKGVPKTDVNYQKTLDAIAQRFEPTLTSAEKTIWATEQEAIRRMIQSMIRAENKDEEIIRLDAFIVEFEKIHFQFTGQKHLTDVQKAALRKPEADGLTLRDLMRREYGELHAQRQRAAYASEIKAILNILFPKGEKDLTFIPEELRKLVWDIIEKNLFPQILPIMTEVMFDPDIINIMVVKSLEIMRDSLNEPVTYEPEVPGPLDELDKVAGDLILEVLNTVKLPAWIKNIVTERKRNSRQIIPAMKKALGSTLRNQFNEKFLRDKLKLALESIIERDEKGESLLDFDTRDKDIQMKDNIRKRSKRQEDLKRLSREVLDVSISYFMRSQWVKFRAQVNGLVKRRFGTKVSEKLKGAVDAISRSIFVKMIGYFLSVVLKPVKNLLYRVILLDLNRDRILKMFTETPMGQPETSNGYAVFHEDLLFKALQEIQEFLEPMRA